jgi:DNA (cytosine-5)-methyltransferase 1
MRMLDLFSGIGGFALAAKWVWEDELDIVGFCEIEKYAQKVLQKNFPGVPIYEDITKLNGKSFKNIDLLTGGFPCQDISIAGKGAGLEGARSGLWTEMHRIISEVRPRFALIENVPMLTIRGGTRVIADLAEIGYDCEWQIIGADDVGAWHRRKRIWIVAYLPDTDKQRLERHRGECELGESGEEVKVSRESNATNSNSSRSNQKSERRKDGLPDTKSKFITRFNNQNISNKEQRKFRGGSGRKRKPDFWSVEPNVGRVAHGIPNRVDRLKGLGNAIVPQVAALIMERIKNA